MHTTTQPIAFAPAVTTVSVHTPTFLSCCGGVVLGGGMLFCVLLSGFMTVQDDAMGMWYVMGGSLLLIVSARYNWRLLWNGFGRLMRSLVGERAARVYFALTGVVFALGGLLATVATDAVK